MCREIGLPGHVAVNVLARLLETIECDLNFNDVLKLQQVRDNLGR